DISRSYPSARRETRVPVERYRREARDALDGVRNRHASVQRRVHGSSLPHGAHTEMASIQSAKISQCPAGLSFWHCSFIHNKHKLAGLQRRIDRKSTRLNSSHLVTSYAV